MKRALFDRGVSVMSEFCRLNDMPSPEVRESDHPRRFSTCAYYRGGATFICVPACAAIGTAGRNWSFPGYTVDRTPYGVLQHELGHHVDVTRSTRKGNYYGDFGIALRGQSGEEPITSYCPNDAEWFAEMFRVFVTNPDLLRLTRPRTHRELSACFKPLFSDDWLTRLAGAPERTIAAARRKVESAA